MKTKSWLDDRSDMEIKQSSGCFDNNHASSRMYQYWA